MGDIHKIITQLLIIQQLKICNIFYIEWNIHIFVLYIMNSFFVLYLNFQQIKQISDVTCFCISVDWEITHSPSISPCSWTSIPRSLNIWLTSTISLWKTAHNSSYKCYPSSPKLHFIFSKMLYNFHIYLFLIFFFWQGSFPQSTSPSPLAV